jgi:hypothetical protein
LEGRSKMTGLSFCATCDLVSKMASYDVTTC